MTLIIDAHEDLAHNMLTLGRDYTRPVGETRQKELAAGISGVKAEETTLGWDAYQRGQIAVVFSTLFSAPYRAQEDAWDKNVYRNAEEAHQHYWSQLELYHRLVDKHPDYFRLILTQPDLKDVLAEWEKPLPQPTHPDEPAPVGHPVGMVVLMEGAEGVRTPGELESWWEGGVRLIGPAWAGTRFCGGTREPGPLTAEGRQLLEGMLEIGFGLDLAHMDAQAALQALEMYEGTVLVSHGNPLAMLKGTDSNRHLPDAVVDGVIARDGVIGVVLFNKFLKANWTNADGKEAVTLNTVAAHIDYVCQRAGDAKHVAIGTDFDGGYGKASIPAEMDTVADLQKLVPILTEKGYSDADIAGIFHGNWERLLHKVLPEK